MRCLLVYSPCYFGGVPGVPGSRLCRGFAIISQLFHSYSCAGSWCPAVARAAPDLRMVHGWSLPGCAVALVPLAAASRKGQGVADAPSSGSGTPLKQIPYGCPVT